jgi:Uma2 family endonuclease
MSTISIPSLPQAEPRARYENLAEWLHDLGDVPPERILMDPLPGTATEKDLLRFVERDRRLVELVDGTLVEKPVGWFEALIAGKLLTVLNNFVLPRRLGVASGPDGTLKMKSGRIRLPDLAFVSVDDLPGGQLPTEPVPMIPFRLAVEVISEGNTSAEMRQKMKEYFESGTQLVWLIYPKTKTIEIYERLSDQPSRILGEAETLDGGSVLPGFSVPVADIFAPLQR